MGGRSLSRNSPPHGTGGIALSGHGFFKPQISQINADFLSENHVRFTHRNRLNAIAHLNNRKSYSHVYICDNLRNLADPASAAMRFKKNRPPSNSGDRIQHFLGGFEMSFGNFIQDSFTVSSHQLGADVNDSLTGSFRNFDAIFFG